MLGVAAALLFLVNLASWLLSGPRADEWLKSSVRDILGPSDD
jgi:hypothetical protein